MTCIVGLVDKDGKVWIGGDSAGVNGYLDLSIRKEPKVFRNNAFLIGCAGSARTRDLLQCVWTPPDYYAERDKDLRKFLVATVVESIRTCFKAGGVARIESGEEATNNSMFLFGLAGHLYTIHADYQVLETLCGYAAIGCGCDYANGVLHANPDLPPRERIESALKAAEAHNAGVRGPWTIECLEHAAIV